MLISLLAFAPDSLYLRARSIEQIPMPEENRATPEHALEAHAETLRDGFRKLDRRQWWLWSTTVLVILLLTIAIASFAFPALLDKWDVTHSADLSLSVNALVGIVLVFAV